MESNKYRLPLLRGALCFFLSATTFAAPTPKDGATVETNPVTGLPYCEHGCDIAEDCRNNHPPAPAGQEWTCINKKGFCVGKCTLQQKAPIIIECATPYALCANIVCEKSNSPHTASCHCPIYNGKNWGTTSCAERLYANENHEVYSEYSPRHLLASSTNGSDNVAKNRLFFPEKVCSDAGHYEFADCFNVKCFQGKNGLAECGCPIIHSSNGSFLIESSDCEKDLQLCKLFSSPTTQRVMNGATMGLGLAVINTSLKEGYQTHLKVNDFCKAQAAK